MTGEEFLDGLENQRRLMYALALAAPGGQQRFMIPMAEWGLFIDWVSDNLKDYALYCEGQETDDEQNTFAILLMGFVCSSDLLLTKMRWFNGG